MDRLRSWAVMWGLFIAGIIQVNDLDNPDVKPQPRKAASKPAATAPASMPTTRPLPKIGNPMRPSYAELILQNVR